MPKPMMLHVGVEEAFFGKIFRMLDGMPGVASLNIVSEAHPPQAKQSKGTVADGSTTHCIVLKALITAKRTMSKAELAKALTEAGKKPSSLPSALQSLKKKRLIINQSRDNWKITPQGQSFFANNCTEAK